MGSVRPQAPLVLLLLLMVPEREADSADPVPVTASKGEDAALPCFNSTVLDPERCFRVRLFKQDSNSSQTDVFAWPTKSREANRWKLDRLESLHLKDVRRSDEGLYRCEVCRGWDCTVVKTFHLRVKDCKTSPAVKAARGKVVSLTCQVEKTQQQEPKNLSWAILKGGNPVPLDLSSSRIQQNLMALVIRSVTDGDKGWYRCQYTLGPAQRCCDTHLIVQAVIDTTTSVPVAATTEQAPTSVEPLGANSQGRTAFIAAMTCAAIGVLITAAMVAIYVSFRSSHRMVAPSRSRGHPAVAENSLGPYETVMLPDDLSALQVRIPETLYNEAGMCTFQRW